MNRNKDIDKKGVLKNHNNKVGCLPILGGLIFVVFLFLLFSRRRFVDEKVAIRAAEIQGYTNVQIIGRENYFVDFKGGDGDAARFTIKATNPIGKEVVFYVFVGWPFKGATIRTK